jgi:hypothetical protein
MKSKRSCFFACAGKLVTGPDSAHMLAAIMLKVPIGILALIVAGFVSLIRTVEEHA